MVAVLVHLRLEFRKLETALEHNYAVMLLFCFSVNINSYNKIFLSRDLNQIIDLAVCDFWVICFSSPFFSMIIKSSGLL